MKEKELDRWFHNLDGKQLERMFPDILATTQKNGGDFNDFIDDCDEWWGYLNLKTKAELYNHFGN